MKEVNRQNGKLVLGDGEVTGHQHTVADKGAQLFALDDSLMQLSIPEGATLRHTKGDQPAEHRDIRLPSGEPIVSHKRQYNPDGGWESVQD